MLKVLIADDEVKVCQLIRHLIDWEELGFEIIACVNDGLTAYRMIKEENPDIVITDIRMPEFDGIELIHHVKEFNPKIHFIIISGYSHFEYAHNAIKYGVLDYLLKPIKKKELMETLNKFLTEHQQSTLDKVEKQYLQEQLISDSHKMKKNFLKDLLNLPDRFSNSITIAEINQEYRCSLVEGEFQAFIVRNCIGLYEESMPDYDLLMQKTEAKIKIVLKDTFSEMITLRVLEGIICIINQKKGEAISYDRQLKKIRSEVTSWKDLFKRIDITIGVGRSVSQISQLAVSVEEAKSAALYSLVAGSGQIINYGTFEPSHHALSPIVGSTVRNRLLSCMEIYDMNGITLSLANIVESLKKLDRADGDFIKKVYLELVDIFLFGLKTCGLDQKYLRNNKLIEEFYMISGMEEIFEYLSDEMTGFLREQIEEKKQENMKPIRVAKQYIADNFSRSLTLEEVSAKIGFNASYFSTIFKKETGENFTEYLVQIRIQNAKQLLMETELAVADIAEQVGYSDIKYFSKLFKKTAGLNPKEFRKLYN